MPDRPLKVFLDANVVIRAGKPPGAPVIPRVADLVDAGYVKVVTTDLTKMEVAKKHANNDFEIIGGVARKRFRELTEEAIGVKLPNISSEELQTKLFDKYWASTDAMFKKLRAETLSIDGVEPSAVFESYSRKTGLFSGEAKKDQFPDAFIWDALKAVATQSDPLIIVTDDGDFDAGIRDHEHITRLKSIPDLFAKVGLTIEAAPEVETFFEQHDDDVVATVDDELNQWSLQVSDIEDAEIDESTVSSVTFLYFTTFRAAGDSKDILVVGRLEMEVNVLYNHPGLGHIELRQRGRGPHSASSRERGKACRHRGGLYDDAQCRREGQARKDRGVLLRRRQFHLGLVDAQRIRFQITRTAG